MKIYLATWLAETSQGEALTEVKSKRRLVSYYFLIQQKISESMFAQYLKTGR